MGEKNKQTNKQTKKTVQEASWAMTAAHRALPKNHIHEKYVQRENNSKRRMR